MFSQKATDGMFISVDFQSTAALNPTNTHPHAVAGLIVAVQFLASAVYSTHLAAVTALYRLPALESGCSPGPLDLSPFVSPPPASCKTEMTPL